MRAALVSEYRKLVSTRLWWVLLLTMVGYMAFVSGILAVSLVLGAEQQGAEMPFGPLDLARTLYGVAASWGFVFPVVVGTLSVTGEFRHQTITPTFLAEPRRGRVLLAKFLSSAPVGLVYGLLGTATTVAIGAGILALRDQPTFLGEWEVQRGILLAVVALAVWTMLGVGIGAVVPNQVVAVLVVIAYTQFVEPTLRALAAFVDGGPAIARFLPGAAGDAMAGASFYEAIATAEGPGLLSWWQGALVLLAYAVVLGVVGARTTFRKDIT